MTDRPELNLESLPADMREALAAALKQEPARTALVHQNTDAWPLLIDAAVVGTFLPRQLAPDAVSEERRPEAENIVLSFAEMTHSPEGVKWSLTQQTRAEVLQAALQTDDLKESIARTDSEFKDVFSKALREILIEGSNEDVPFDLKSLEATRIAVASLSGISGMNLPPVEKLDREIEFRRLLAPFERMIGRRLDEKGREKENRFFGRDDEMEDLRKYVGVVPADSLFGAAKRALDWIARKFKGRTPKSVWGVGGVGKTTLISKFMLEHAEAASSRFPFAYIDFDRMTINARQKSELLAEMCLQTGAQIEKLSKPMASLRARAQELTRKLEASREYESMSLLFPLTHEFRKLVDDYLESLEIDKPFLLVFDTFELVQYSEDDVIGLEEFVMGFSHSGESTEWPRLRVIISGRQQVKEFLGTVEDLPLGALDHKGSTDLLCALAQDAGKPITPKIASTLVSAVAKATKERGGGVQPLRLRLIGEVFNKMDDDGPTIVRSLIKDVRKPLKSNTIAAQIFIDGILVRRVLEHVKDARVRALADPGLVVRRITRDVIKEVMTRGTSEPSVNEPEDADADPVKPWIVDDAEAQSIFDAFSKEVSLVESFGDWLRHRKDVRQQMLPLIRARRRKRFESLNRLAFNFFRARAEQNDKDLDSAAEAVYHGLWLNEPLSELNQLWRTSPAFNSRLEPEDFDEGSLANIFVRAKAHSPLTSNEVLKLPREVALEWLDARSADLLRDRRIEDAILAVQAAAGDDYAALDERIETVAVLARLLYRAGVWDDAVRLTLRHLDRASNEELMGPEGKSRPKKASSQSEALLSLARTWATIAGKSDGPTTALERISAIASAVHDPLARVEIAAHAHLAIKQLGSEWQSRNEELKSVIEYSIPDISRDQWKEEPRILRLAILASGDHATELMKIWFESLERVPRGMEASTLSNLLLQIFRDEPEMPEIIEGLHSRQRSEVLSQLDVLWRRGKSVVLEALRASDDNSGFRMMIAFDHSDWVRPLGNALTLALKQDNREALMSLLSDGGYLSRRRVRQQDGVAVVQIATDEGRILGLAEALAQWEKPFVSQKVARNQPAYPQDVVDISRALLRWHSGIIKSFETTSRTQSPS